MMDKKSLESRALRILRGSKMPVSIDYVAYNLGVCWATARALLFEMALKGAVKAVKTSKSWIFVAVEDEHI